MEDITIENLLIFVIFAILLLLIGIVLLFYPQTISKYENGLVRFAKDSEDHIFMLRVFGLITFIIAIIGIAFILILSIFSK